MSRGGDRTCARHRESRRTIMSSSRSESSRRSQATRSPRGGSGGRPSRPGPPQSIGPLSRRHPDGRAALGWLESLGGSPEDGVEGSGVCATRTEELGTDLHQIEPLSEGGSGERPTEIIASTTPRGARTPVHARRRSRMEKWRVSSCGRVLRVETPSPQRREPRRRSSGDRRIA